MDDDACSRPSQIEVCATAHTNAPIRHLVKSVIRGLKACQEPERALDGMGGTYFFCNENGRKVGRMGRSTMCMGAPDPCVGIMHAAASRLCGLDHC